MSIGLSGVGIDRERETESTGLSGVGIDRETERQRALDCQVSASTERDRRGVTKTENSNTKPVNIEMYYKCMINDSTSF